MQIAATFLGRALPIASAVLGITSGIGVFIPEFAVIALPGLILGAIAMFRKDGHIFARAGILASCSFMVLTAIVQVVQFHQESPSGFERVSFANVTAATGDGLAHFSGKRICLKGYASPQKSMDVASFALSADGSGAMPEDFVLVELQPGETWHWDAGGIAVSGILIQDPNSGVDQTHFKFRLVQSSVRRSMSILGLAYRARRNGC